MSGCKHCDGQCGSESTYAGQVQMDLGGSKPVCIDGCIADIIRALNAGGVRTVACCCGHMRRPGEITLADGRILVLWQQTEKG